MNAEWTRDDRMSARESDYEGAGEHGGSFARDYPRTDGGLQTDWGVILGSLGAGMALAYLFSPGQGRRHRAYLRDQAVGVAHDLSRGVGRTARDLRNRATGMAAETAAAFRREMVPDEVLVQRVRAAMGRAVSHPRPIQVTAMGGRVTLSGPVLANEAPELLATVRRVRGVQAIENRLERHPGPGHLPELQGGSTRRSRLRRAEANWDSSTRLLTGAMGGALAAYGASRRDTPGILLALLGTGLLLRAATNTEVNRLTGVGAGRRAVELHKTLNIAAPSEEVFAFCSHYANFPRFMAHVREVKGDERGQSHWVVDGPAGVPVSYDAVVTQFIPNRILAWKTVEDSPIPHAGFLRFEPNADGSTRLDIHMSYNPPAGAAGHAVATLFGANPKQQMDEDFLRLKSLMETGKTSAPGEGEVTRDQLAA